MDYRVTEPEISVDVPLSLSLSLSGYDCQQIIIRHLQTDGKAAKMEVSSVSRRKTGINYPFFRFHQRSDVDGSHTNMICIISISFLKNYFLSLE